MLTDRISELTSATSAELELEDIFESSLTTIFNDVRNQHGEPGHYVAYASPKYGEIKLGLADIEKAQTSLFSHHLWNAGVEVAGMIETGELNVDGETVLELGAGAALPSLLSAISGAKTIVITDYPAPEILANITSNVALNKPKFTSSDIQVYGHTWGNLDEEVATKYAHSFTRIIAADTLWMTWEHENLVKSMLHFLDDSPTSRVVVVAGLHTGRQKMANFWDVAGESFDIDTIVERDIDGIEREYKADRGIEDVIERKRWLIVGTLKKKSSL
ncbi:hypothetical protein TWF730_003806 [Orbilia blumenaviensis]|uniref:Uncharacterized protein n=1 Tax=Orbilia blumenaviensis TaxID=1796055 RepID=A0AAV9U155_9PEZI